MLFIRESKRIISAALFEVDESFIFEHLLCQANSDYVSEKIVKVDVQPKDMNTWHKVVSGIDASLKICIRKEQNISHIWFTVQNEQLVFSLSQILSTSNVFNEIMNSVIKKILSNLKLIMNHND
ncbi:12410_t:CDS:2 [Cetraspora pellucida]|uniref:12410_t:CDS:1 n=1 Tax=Cetraspora pellucida TaxID=1433469 RepID=A0A9N9H539_9GLOM|nr:12410_t:CDS:2 [Cetraspora pellucida]